jgi:P27 family predicted phage terminase small subunit
MAQRRKTTAERELQGDPGHKSKASKAAIDAPATVDVKPIGNAPAWISAEGRKVWDLAAPALEAIRFLGAPDKIAFARYCEWLAVFFKAKGKKNLKPTEVTRSKAVKMTRLDKTFQALLLLDKRLLEYEDRFGMSPQARQAILARLAAGFNPPPSDPPAADRPAKGDARGPVGILAGPQRLQ